MKKTIKIPSGLEIDLENSSKNITVLKKKECGWEDFWQVKGYYTTTWAGIGYGTSCKKSDSADKNTFVTLEDTVAVLALSQLLQLRNKTVGDWKPDFRTDSRKYAIIVCGDEIEIRVTYFTQFILTFENRGQAYKFMDDPIELIKQAKPLL